jgi:hypothetical protein
MYTYYCMLLLDHSHHFKEKEAPETEVIPVWTRKLQGSHPAHSISSRALAKELQKQRYYSTRYKLLYPICKELLLCTSLYGEKKSIPVNSACLNHQRVPIISTVLRKRSFSLHLQWQYCCYAQMYCWHQVLPSAVASRQNLIFSACC